MKKFYLKKDLPKIKKGEEFFYENDLNILYHNNEYDERDEELEIGDINMEEWFDVVDDDEVLDELKFETTTSISMGGKSIIRVMPKEYDGIFPSTEISDKYARYLQKAYKLFKTIFESHAGSFTFDGYRIDFSELMTDKEREEKQKKIEQFQRNYEESMKKPQYVSEILDKDSDVLLSVDEGDSIGTNKETTDDNNGEGETA